MSNRWNYLRVRLSTWRKNKTRQLIAFSKSNQIGEAVCDNHSTHGPHHATLKETVHEIAPEVEAQQEQQDEQAQEVLLAGQARGEGITLELELRQGKDFERFLNRKSL